MTRITHRIVGKLKERRGAVLTFVAIAMVVLLGIAAFAIDLGYLHVVKAELQNAADAGALAGAAALFNKNGILQDFSTVIEPAAVTAATSNNSGGSAVSTPTVEIGHYAFSTSGGTPGVFTASNATSQLSNWETISFACLNCLDGVSDCTSQCGSDMTGQAFINAVRVTTSKTNVPTFFSKIFGLSSLAVTNVQAVAYIGFAGSLQPLSVNWPIAICKQCIVSDPSCSGSNCVYSCSDGRMINSTNGNYSSNTAGWTNFSQDPCQTATPANTPVSCSAANEYTIFFGEGMGLTNGQDQSIFATLYDNCWLENGKPPTQPLSLTLPVADCGGTTCGGPVSNCATVVGAVNVSIIWMVNQNDNYASMDPTKNYNVTSPTQGIQMGGWSCTVADCGAASNPGECCWDGTGASTDFESFVDYFHLVNPVYQQKAIYFKPSCSGINPTGTAGGENFGVLAKYPVLVK